MMKKIILAAAVIVTMAACTKDDTVNTTSSSIEATFTAAQIATRTVANTWENNDQVGIYMYENGKTASSYYLSRENVLYTTDLVGDFTIATGFSSIYYPQNDVVDFYAYYPYQAGIATTYTADITAQNIETEGVVTFDQGAVDFMTASLKGNYKRSSALSFTFDHQLAMLTLVLTPKVSVASFEGMVVKLEDMNTKATFSTLTGAMNTVSTKTLGEVQFLTTSKTTDPETGDVVGMTLTAIVLPEMLDSGAKLTFSLGQDNFWASFPASTAFTAGNNHTYYVSVGYDNVSFSDSIITPWTETVDGTLDADEVDIN